MTFRILTVCTRNICRSPLAAQWLRGDLSSGSFEVHSAVVAALEGAPMPDEAQDIAGRLGHTAHQDHRGRQLVADEVARADVVFAMDREHRQAVVELHPPVVRYAYILTKFAHVASNVPKTNLVAMVQRANDPERGALDAMQRL